MLLLLSALALADILLFLMLSAVVTAGDFVCHDSARLSRNRLYKISDPNGEINRAGFQG